MAVGNLRAKDATGATFIDLRYANAESLITAATLEGTGREIADVYTITVSDFAAGSPNTFTATVTTASTKNPYHSTVFAGVVADGATARRDIIPGVTLTFTASGSLANGWSSTVSIGWYAGTQVAGNPSGVQLSWASGVGLPGLGSVAAGEPGAIGKFLLTNTGAESLADAKLEFFPRLKLVNKTLPWGLHSIEVIDTTPVERVAGDGQILPITFTFANLDTAASPDEIDVLMNEGSGAATFDVRDLDAGANITSTQLKMDGTTRYQIRESGAKLENAIFRVATTATTAAVENVLAFNRRNVEFALDVAGTPGTWGTSSLTLTQSGQPTGVILPGGTVAVWVRWNIPATASAKQNVFPGDLVASYALTGIAGWLS
jgi:hypothetical protein